MVAWQTPPTKSGERIIFLTLEDEDSLMQIVVFPHAQDKCVPALHTSPLLLVKGTVQRRGRRATVIAEEITAITGQAYQQGSYNAAHRG